MFEVGTIGAGLRGIGGALRAGRIIVPSLKVKFIPLTSLEKAKYIH